MIDQLHYISQQKEGLSHLEAIKNALEAGCKWIQLRVKNQPESVVRDIAVQAKLLCDSFSAKLIINDFPELAKEVSAFGLHLGLQDMPIPQAREIVGPDMIIGGTANTCEHIQLRVQEGADYVGLGPLRFTTTKEKLSPILGMEGYRRILAQMAEAGISIPIIAIGAVELEDVAELLEAGLYGVAVSGAITFAADRAQTVAEFYEQLGKDQSAKQLV
ncbi:thiamine phosphate synthase [Pedobacter sp. SYSU D00535]|uniref:thiamine phosphate synthase n=1 Tax=Pedobacter sp. SYSU D00535 TaxID=2810308 RepID=UPI001A9758DC|nr:thiamine phosphate synthase [Pedobacter sp. SYSU D00535]